MNSAPSIIKRVITLSAVGALALTAATFVPGDTFAGSSGGSTFNSKGLTLQIDSSATYDGAKVPSETWNAKNLVPGTDKFFNYSDIKPGDYGCNVISVHTEKSDAYECVDFTGLQNNDNGLNNPEIKAGDTTGGAGQGDLAQGLQFFGWIDNGDGKYNPKTEQPLFGTAAKSASVVLNNTSYALGDSKSGGSCKQNTTKYFATCWCAGTLSVDSKGNFSCDGSTLGNRAQGDSVSLSVDVRAVVAADNAKFTCATSSTSTPPPSNGGGYSDGGKGDHDDKGGKGDDGKGGYGQGWTQTKGGFSWNSFPFFGHKS
jgi:hypothetical protein